MSFGLIGLKQGMTQLYNDDGTATPVTVIKVEPNFISQIKTKEKEKYCGIQITTGKIKPTRLKKPMAGHFAKANIQPGSMVGEFRIHDEDIADGFDFAKYKVGDVVGVDLFQLGQRVDVAGISRGQGFQGVIKRWNFKSQKQSHGNSLSHNAPGSIGQNQSPGRVFKGKKMAGQTGNERVTTQNLQIAYIDAEAQLIMIKGAVPGPSGRYVWIYPTVKKVRQSASRGQK